MSSLQISKPNLPCWIMKPTQGLRSPAGCSQAALSDKFLYVTMDVINMFTLGDGIKW